jgi:hypothetical protein
MIVIPQQHRVESPYVEWVGHGYTLADALAVRPADFNWYLIFTRQAGALRTLVAGPSEVARPLGYTGGAESLWIRFSAGTVMLNAPPITIRNREIELPAMSGKNFWLGDRAWEIPTFENSSTFVERLVRTGALTFDPLVQAALRGEPAAVPARTLRHRFRHSTGLRQSLIHQIRRARHAVELLTQGNSPLGTAHELGYADQPHLTRSVKRFLGYTPSELMVSSV